jgi:hypothetical protein
VKPGGLRERVFETTDYADPGQRVMNGRGANEEPRLVKLGESLRYLCRHDNGSADPADVKLGCEEQAVCDATCDVEAGACRLGGRAVACTTDQECADAQCQRAGGTQCVAGTCAVVPGKSAAEAVLGGLGLSGAAKRCTTGADCCDAGGPCTDPAYPRRTFTGNCGPANLVFGFTSDDDMCILPGSYYDANPDAAPGEECDLKNL